MGQVKVSLIERIKRTPTIESFRFWTKESFKFIPGQFVKVLFDPANPGNKDLNKYLSLSASPNKGYLEVTKRLSQSLFSEKLKALKPRDELILDGPLGNCVLHENDKQVGFLVGGIGITPVISIMEYATEKKLAIDMELLYSSRNEEDIAFKQELDELRNINPRIKIGYTVTESLQKDASLISGAINKELFLERISNFKERAIYIFGPPKMVEAMQGICLEAGVLGEHIKKKVS